jgi:hypothetical protein
MFITMTQQTRLLVRDKQKIKAEEWKNIQFICSH